MLTRPEAPPAPAPAAESDPPPAEAQAVAAAPADPCASAALDATAAEGFAALAGQLRACAGSLSADDALGYVEAAANRGDAAALTLFGRLYDGSETDAALETRMGLTFGDADPRAAEYYARAVAAGSDEAAGLLAAVCARLSGASDTLARSAAEDHCGPAAAPQ